MVFVEWTFPCIASSPGGSGPYTGAGRGPLYTAVGTTNRGRVSDVRSSETSRDGSSGRGSWLRSAGGPSAVSWRWIDILGSDTSWHEQARTEGPCLPSLGDRWSVVGEYLGLLAAEWLSSTNRNCIVLSFLLAISKIQIQNIPGKHIHQVGNDKCEWKWKPERH